MNDHSHKHLTKKEEIQARNKRHLIVNQLSELANEAPPGSHPLAAPVGVLHADPIIISSDTPLGTKLDSIRNRINGRKRLAKDRWNRFSGTSGGGGRGL